MGVLQPPLGFKGVGDEGSKGKGKGKGKQLQERSESDQEKSEDEPFSEDLVSEVAQEFASMAEAELEEDEEDEEEERCGWTWQDVRPLPLSARIAVGSSACVALSARIAVGS